VQNPVYLVLCSCITALKHGTHMAGVPQTPEPISAAIAPKFTILGRHVEEILLLSKVFPIVDASLSCEDIYLINLWDGAQMAIFCVIFPSCISSEPHAAHFRPAF